MGGIGVGDKEMSKHFLSHIIAVTSFYCILIKRGSFLHCTVHPVNNIVLTADSPCFTTLNLCTHCL